MVKLFDFLFKLLMWSLTTIGCIIYGIWAVIKYRIRQFNDTSEVEKVVTDG